MKSPSAASTSFLVALGINLFMPDASAQDAINNVPIIERLDVEALPRGKTYHFWFKAMDTNVGQSWYVPVIVNRGNEAGPRLLLNSGVHGDELNGIRVVQIVTASVDLQKLHGTIIGIPGLNIPGLLHGNRNYIMSDDGGSAANLNRVMPGDEEKGDAARRFAGRVWQKLWLGNVDYVVDLHSQSRGSAYPTFVYVDPRNEGPRKIAELIAPDVIKYDAGEKGSVETEFVRVNIPAVTYEIGHPSIWQQDLIDRSVSGIDRVMASLKMLEGLPAQSKTSSVPDPPAAGPFLGNENTTLRAKIGGFIELKVALLDMVQTGQLVARQMNAFGDTIAEFRAPHDGKVLSIGDEPLREPGALVVRIIRWNPSDACKLGC